LCLTVHTVYTHINQNSLFILPIHCACPIILGMNICTDGGKKLFSFAYLSFRAMRLPRLRLKWHKLYFPGNGRRLATLTNQLHQAPSLRVGTFVPPFLLCPFIPYNKIIFNFDCNYDDNYCYNDTIVSVRGISECCWNKARTVIMY
jgi:hypothetical protein